MTIWKRTVVTATVLMSLLVVGIISVTLYVHHASNTRMSRYADAVKSGKIEIVQIVDHWKCTQDTDADDALEMELWLKNGLSTEVMGNVVFDVTEDLSRLDPSCWTAKFAGFTDAQILDAITKRADVSDPRMRALAALVRRGRTPAPGIDYEPVSLSEKDDKTFSVQFHDILELGPHEVAKVRHRLAFPPSMSGYSAKVSLVKVE